MGAASEERAKNEKPHFKNPPVAFELDSQCAVAEAQRGGRPSGGLPFNVMLEFDYRLSLAALARVKL